MFAVCMPAFAAEAGFDITKAIIAISSDAPQTDTYAAQRLKYYLDEITGGNIEIVADSTSAEYVISILTEESSKADGSY